MPSSIRGVHRCSSCKKEKPLGDFHLRRATTGERHNRCKDCRKDESRSDRAREYGKAYREANAAKVKADIQAWRDAHPEHRREYMMVKRYGVTLARRDAMLADQGGVCAICGRPEPGRRWGIDHDHSCCPGGMTCGNCVRGILCESCNAAIGLLRDDPDVMRRAAEYVEAHAAKV